MKQISTILIIGIIIVSGFGAVANSIDTIQINSDSENRKTLVFPLSLPDFTNCQILDTDNGQKIIMEDFGRLSIPGEPNIPSRIFSFALPPNAQFEKVYYETSKEIIIQDIQKIPPITPAQITYNDITTTLQSDYQIYQENYNSIYNCDTPYPKNIVQIVGTSGYRQYNIVDVKVTPFTYNPISRLLTYFPEITVFIEYLTPVENFNEMVDISIKTEKIASEIIVNYEQAKHWYPTDIYSNQGLYDFVIITLDELTSAVTPLVDWEIQKGKSVKVITSSWIDSNYNGYDLAEKMRNFLREKYTSDQWGIEDLLIIGHRDDIPMRGTSQSIGFNGEKPETDFYYAELSKPDNESWDMDGDHRYGENSDTIDYFGEINVGRIPWSDYETVNHICEKSVSYEKNTEPSYKNNILLLAAFVDDNTDGATFMEYCINADIHPWMTHWMKTRLYQKGSNYVMDYYLTHNNVVDVWSSGKYAFVSWHAHGNPYGSGNFISVDDCIELNDEYPAIISAASCSNADTDYLNIGQAMMKQGAVGFLGANKAAFYRSAWDNPNDGSDQSFKYFFISCITSGEYTQGQAHQYALREMYARGLWDSLKYDTFVHGSLWGNPDLGLGSFNDTIPPEQPLRPDGPNSGRIRVRQTYTTSTIDRNDDDIYYLFDWGDGLDSGWIGPYGSGETAEASHVWTEMGDYEIKVVAQDSHNAMSPWSDQLVISLSKNKLKYSLFELIEQIREESFILRLQSTCEQLKLIG